MWCCFVGWVVPNFSKECVKPLTPGHSIMSQKTWVLSHTAVRTSDLTLNCLPYIWNKNHCSTVLFLIIPTALYFLHAWPTSDINRKLMRKFTRQIIKPHTDLCYKIKFIKYTLCKNMYFQFSCLSAVFLYIYILDVLLLSGIMCLKFKFCT